MDYEAYVLNLDRSEERMAAFRVAFANALPIFTRISGCVGSTLPDVVTDLLVRNFPSAGKGGLGATLSHAAAWEKILKSDKPYGIILEDDTQPLKNFPKLISDLGLQADFDVCFANQRMSKLNDYQDSDLTYISCIEALRGFPPNHNTPGGDCYIVSKAGAEKLLQLFSTDGFGSFLDWRIVAYCVTREEAKTLAQGSTARAVIDILHNKSGSSLEIDGYVLASPLVKALGGPSDIGLENDKK